MNRSVTEAEMETLGLIMRYGVHTDYTQRGSQIMVSVFADRLVIQNPGMMPFGMTIDDFKAGVSRIRNPVIARVFRELDLMEEWGSGYRRIQEDCHADRTLKELLEQGDVEYTLPDKPTSRLQKYQLTGKDRSHLKRLGSE